MIRAARLTLHRLRREVRCENRVVAPKSKSHDTPISGLRDPSTGAASGSAVPRLIETTEPVSPAPPPPAESLKRSLSITVSGNELVNESGEDVTLHGVNIMGTQWQCLFGHAFADPSDEASIEAMASWHINAVRIPLNEDCWLGINGAPPRTAAYHEELRGYVDRLHAHGLYAILDLHWSAPGATLSHIGPGFAGFFEMADKEHAPTFWASLASYFADDHAVLFDLYNEPNDISWSCWRNGCSAPRGYETAGMQELVDAIRGVGATQPIMVGGLELAGQLGREWLENRPADPQSQLVASAHLYGYTNVGKLDQNIGVVARQFPVVLGETGESNCADNDLSVLLPWADESGVSYLAWAWYTGECASYALVSDYSGTPTNYGLGYREHLRANFPAPST
jgi:endoglucanase